MTIFIDADACPVVRIAERAARERGVPVMLVCDTNHVLSSDYSKIITVGAGADAVDFALVNMCRAGDIVITQDYGVAAMALSRGARAIHQSGMIYTSDNIDALLAERHAAAKARRAHGKTHIRGPAKRTERDDIAFERAFVSLLE